MMIGLISDTHIPSAGKEPPLEVREAFRGVDLILHAGDLHVLSVLDWLQEIAPVLACRGNGDSRLPEDHRLKETQTVTVDGLRIGLSHDLPLPEEPPWRTLENIMTRYFGSPVDVIVFGDTHVEIIDTYKGVLLVNPGSPNLPHNVEKLGTVALLEVKNGRAEARIIHL